MYEKLDDIIDGYLKKADGKEIIIWGSRRGESFLRELFFRKGRKEQITVIDMDPAIPALKTGIHRYLYLEYVNFDKTIIFSTAKDYESVLSIVRNYGYKDKKNVINARLEIGNSYTDYLKQYEYTNIDFSPVRKSEYPDLFTGDNYESIPVDLISLEKVLIAISKKYHCDSFFDYGCGKGQALLVADKCGIKKIGGIEYENKIYK